MKITATPILVTPEQALKEARKGGNIFGRMLYGKKDVNLRLLYLESREVILDLYYRPAPLLRFFGKKMPEKPSQKIRIMVEGTRGGASYIGEDIKTVKVDVEEEGIQNTEIPDYKIVQEASRLAMRMVRRQIGKIAEPKLNTMRSIYRPFYIAFYGELKMGEKVRYLPIAADGNRIERSL